MKTVFATITEHVKHQNKNIEGFLKFCILLGRNASKELHSITITSLAILFGYMQTEAQKLINANRQWCISQLSDIEEYLYECKVRLSDLHKKKNEAELFPEEANDTSNANLRRLKFKQALNYVLFTVGILCEAIFNSVGFLSVESNKSLAYFLGVVITILITVALIFIDIIQKGPLSPTKKKIAVGFFGTLVCLVIAITIRYRADYLATVQHTHIPVWTIFVLAVFLISISYSILHYWIFPLNKKIADINCSQHNVKTPKRKLKTIEKEIGHWTHERDEHIRLKKQVSETAAAAEVSICQAYDEGIAKFRYEYMTNRGVLSDDLWSVEPPALTLYFSHVNTNK